VLAEWDWRTADSIFEPDIMIVPLDSPADILRQPPLLVVEILLPSNRLDDLITKRAKYQAASAPWYWIVDLDEPSLVVLRNDEDLFVEVERLLMAGNTVGPVSIQVDPATLGA
jgi:Uma2 family endonuclease